MVAFSGTFPRYFFGSILLWLSLTKVSSGSFLSRILVPLFWTTIFRSNFSGSILLRILLTNAWSGSFLSSISIGLFLVALFLGTFSAAFCYCYFWRAFWAAVFWTAIQHFGTVVFSDTFYWYTFLRHSATDSSDEHLERRFFWAALRHGCCWWHWFSVRFWQLFATDSIDERFEQRLFEQHLDTVVSSDTFQVPFSAAFSYGYFRRTVWAVDFWAEFLYGSF